MIRGTTPTLEFTMPFDTSLIAELYITITQNGATALEKPCQIVTAMIRPYH